MLTAIDPTLHSVRALMSQSWLIIVVCMNFRRKTGSFFSPTPCVCSGFSSEHINPSPFTGYHTKFKAKPNQMLLRCIR